MIYIIEKIMGAKFIIFYCIILIVVSVCVQNRMEAQEFTKKTSSHFFIENKGQWHSDVRYRATVSGMIVWITDYGVVYDYYSIKHEFNVGKGMNTLPYERDISDLENGNIRGHVVRFRHVGVNNNVYHVGYDQRDGYYNYFLGNESKKWSSFVRLYDAVEVKDIYDGINVRYYFDKGLLRYDYIVAPFADVSEIVISLEGEEKFWVNDNGELIIMTNLGEIRHGNIYAYQLIDGDQIEVKCTYMLLEDGSVSFHVGKYYQNKMMIIDPLVYSTFIGGSSDDEVTSIEVDGAGNTYVQGRTRSFDFPATKGAYDEIFKGIWDVFVTKFSTDGSELVYSTFIGGAAEDWGWSMAIDEKGNTYVTGGTWSTDFPTTEGVYDSSHNGRADVFLTKLNASGSELVYSTFIGGSGSEWAFSIILDEDNNAYLCGRTHSTDFPTTPGAYDLSFNGNSDVFVLKINASGSDLIYSTYIGGREHEWGLSIAIDEEGNAYITGGTFSPNFPTIPGAYDRTLNGESDVFVSKINASGSKLIFSTYIGGSYLDIGQSIAIDEEGNTIIAGGTYSPDFPTTSNVYDREFRGERSVFVFKLNADGSGLIYSTFIGGSGAEWAFSMTTDNDGNAYVTGWTRSEDYPTTTAAFDTGFNGSNDAFVTKLDASGSDLIYSTFIGGTNEDIGRAITIESDNIVYVAGETRSTDFPVTIGAFADTFEGENAIFVLKLKLVTTSVRDIPHDYPRRYKLFQNYPNPFNMLTSIKYIIPFSVDVRITVYDLLGREVAVLVDEFHTPGIYRLEFDASRLASGKYFYRLQAGMNVETKRMLLIK